MSSGIEGIEYTVRRSDRARRIRVTVDGELGVVVVIPRRATLRDAELAVRQFTPWIERRLAEQDQTRAQIASRGDKLPYLDQTLTLARQPGRSRVHRSGQVLYVPGTPDPSSDTEAAIERWYRRMARAEITPRLDQACAQLGVSYTQLTIRGQKTRWGSCSRSGAMSFNWRLLLAPEAALDYVVWHEACHRVLMDHSPRFWGLVAQHCPDYATHAAWLRQHGALLVL